MYFLIEEGPMLPKLSKAHGSHDAALHTVMGSEGPSQSMASASGD